MQLDLKKIPFSKRLSKHMIYEETDNLNSGWIKGLYLAFASDTGGSFIGGPSTGPKGFIRVTPTFEGRDIEYSYSATPSNVVLETTGGSVRFAIDSPKVLRIEGNGIGLRLDGVLSFGGTALFTDRGIEFTMGGTIYLIRSHRGKMTLDCRWDLKALRSTDPIIYIEPDENGCFELAIFDTDDAYELPEVTDSFDKSVANSQADYNAFAAGLEIPATEFGEFFSLMAYSIWIGFIPFKGNELACANKFNDQKIYSVDQSIIALPLLDVSRALEIIGSMLKFASPMGLVPTWAAERQNLYEAVPPVYAYTISRLIENERFENISQDSLLEFYNAMSKAVNWWLDNRTNDAGLCFYAYRHECGWQDGLNFGCGTPIAAPDIAAYISLAADSLSKIANIFNKSEDAKLWNEKSKKQLDNLTNILWDNGSFICINAYKTATRQTCPAEGILSLMPLILGKRLPEEIVCASAEEAKALPWNETAVIPSALIIMGLMDCGFDAAAESAAAKLFKSCMIGNRQGNDLNAGSYYPTAACAALLALGRRAAQTKQEVQ